MIYITGDTHAAISRFNSKNFPQGKELTKDDYVIILGDFGLVWDKEESPYETNWLDWLDGKPWTTLFIDGNHENYDRLNTYPVDKWKGGNVQHIRPSVIHLMRGEIFDLDGYKFLAMGGAPSHDISDGILEPDDKCRIYQYEQANRCFRVNHVSWWAEEVPNEKERDNAIVNLTKHGGKVDFILSHEAPIRLLSWEEPNEYSKWLYDNLYSKADFKLWLFGHYHETRQFASDALCFYRDIINLEDLVC